MEVKRPISLSNDGPLKVVFNQQKLYFLEIEFYSIKEQITDTFYVTGYGPLILKNR